MAWWVMTCSTCASREGFQTEDEANIRAAGHAQENPNHSVKVETAGMPKFFGAIEEGFEAVFRGCGGARVGLRGALRHEA